MNMEKIEQFDGPALVRPEHVVLNPEAPASLRRYAVRDDSPLGRAFSAGKLAVGGRREYTADNRYLAGQRYRVIWDTVHAPAGTSGLQERVNSSPQEGRAQENIIAARDLLKRLNAEMSRDHAFVLALFLGEGETASKAVKARVAGFQDATWAFICSALDDLIDAMLRVGIHRMPDVSQQTQGGLSQNYDKERAL